MKRYDLEMPYWARAMPFVILTLFAAVAPSVLLSDAPGFFAVAWVAMVAWQWWYLLTAVHRVVVHDDGAVEWVALARRVRTPPEEIGALRPARPGSIGVLVVEYASGRMRVINQISGFHEVIVHIKNRNPTVVIKGC